MNNKEDIINCIKNRITTEYDKHKRIEWQEIAARKIYSEVIKDIELETLKQVKFGFEIHSDNSSFCNGYVSLCKDIEDKENKL